jgi:hypothetical protein
MRVRSGSRGTTPDRSRIGHRSGYNGGARTVATIHDLGQFVKLTASNSCSQILLVPHELDAQRGLCQRVDARDIGTQSDEPSDS